MASKRGHVKRAVVLAAALWLLYYLLRKFTSTVDFIGDKIANMTLSSNTQQRIYDAALQRLQRNFTLDQSKVLAKLMIAQAMHETGNFTSNVFRNNLNAFGYKRFARSPYQVKDGFKSPEGNNYAAYNDVADSSREVADWIGRRKTKGFATVKTPAEFAKRLKENAYFTDREDVYANALQKHFNSLA